MTAVEVLEWLVEHYTDGEYENAFGENYTWYDITNYRITPQKIVECIQEYEAEKSCVNKNENKNVNKNVNKNFKVGDWVINKPIEQIPRQIVKIESDKLYVDGNVFVFAEDVEHAESPKEEDVDRTDLEYLVQGQMYVNTNDGKYKMSEIWTEELEKKYSYEIGYNQALDWVLHRIKDGVKLLEEPKEAKQKIDCIHWIGLKTEDELQKEICSKINELVDVVNELRGA